MNSESALDDRSFIEIWNECAKSCADDAPKRPPPKNHPLVQLDEELRGNYYEKPTPQE